MACVIASSRMWRQDLVKNVSLRVGAQVSLVVDKGTLNVDYLDEVGATKIFFPHWSYIIPAEIYNRYECVIFHMTDLPFGRGGSPLQNLISRGIYETKVTALRCIEELDAGPVYMKSSLSLHGTAQEIYVRANLIIEDMIVSLIQDSPEPQKQAGDVVVFNRRTERDGCLDELGSIEKVYDYIRMLDADGYPKAFIESKNLRFEFSQASLRVGTVFANVEIKLRPKNSD